MCITKSAHTYAVLHKKKRVYIYINTLYNIYNMDKIVYWPLISLRFPCGVLQPADNLKTARNLYIDRALRRAEACIRIQYMRLFVFAFLYYECCITCYVYYKIQRNSFAVIHGARGLVIHARRVRWSPVYFL